ncbi:MAG: hypothetical protein AABW59_01615 [archaeon]
MRIEKIKDKVFAQASVETIVLLAIGLIITAAFSALVIEQINSSYAQEQQKFGLQAINTLASEANDAYFLGAGTIKTVLITMPSAVDMNRSYISGREIALNVMGTDLFALTKVELRGQWPNEDGSYLVVITAYDEYVSISFQSITIYPTRISETLSQGTSKTDFIEVANPLSVDANYAFTIDFNSSTKATVTSTQGPFVELASNESAQIPITLTCASDAAGTYIGKIILSSEGVISIPVTLLCLSPQPKLAIYPTTVVIPAVRRVILVEEFFVCNNTSTDFNSSKSNISGGNFASIAFTSFSSSIPANSCVDLNLTINAKNAGTYPGELTVTSSGLSAKSNITVLVSG